MPRIRAGYSHHGVDAVSSSQIPGNVPLCLGTQLAANDNM
jgi:hypothetical protein